MIPELPNPSIDRRRLLRSGGLALTFGAVLAACGTNRSGSENPGRIGLAPPGTPLPEGEVNDVVLLRTAQSIEHLLVDVYAAALELGVLDGPHTGLAERLSAAHAEHADAIGAAVTELGGEPFECANPWIWERQIAPILSAIDDSDDQRRDVLNTLQAVEELAARSYQSLVGTLTDAELRSEVMVHGAAASRHAAILAIAVTGAPDAYLSPAVFGEEVLPDEQGFIVPHAIASTFGSLGGVELVVGAPDDEGGRLAVTFQSPAANTYVYDYQSC